MYLVEMVLVLCDLLAVLSRNCCLLRVEQKESCKYSNATQLLICYIINKRRVDTVAREVHYQAYASRSYI